MINKISKFIISIWLVVLLIPNAWSAEELLAGQAFTEPSQLTDMPKKWREQSIQYEKWAQGANIAVSLDQQLYPALLPIIQQYARKNGIDIAVQEGTCGISAKGLKDKIVDIAGFCCPPSEADRLPGIKFYTLGIAAIAILVNSDNPINNITIEQARQIFEGRIFRWSDIKANSRAQRRMIQVLGRLHCKQRPGHWRLLLDNEDLFSPRMAELSTIPDMIMEIADDRYAIGYETLWMLKRHSDQVKTLSIDSVKPTNNAKLISGAYPLYRTYNVTTWKAISTKNAKAQKLVKFLIEYMEQLDSQYGIVSVHKLRKAGWQFFGSELMGVPRH